jgi:hypothetical protein
VALDEIAVVRVRDPHEVRQVGGSAWMKSLIKLRRGGDEVGDDIGHRSADLLNPCRFNPLDGFDRHFGRLHGISCI